MEPLDEGTESWVRFEQRDAYSRKKKKSTRQGLPRRKRIFSYARVLGLIGVSGAALYSATVLLRDSGPGIHSPRSGANPVAVSRPQRLGEVPSISTSTEIRRNPQGRITSVRALHPGSVLDAFCAGTEASVHRKPVSIDPSGESWLGYFKEAKILYEIEIRKEARTGLWLVGNDLDPIIASPIGSAAF